MARFALQAELYDLTQTQHNQLVTAITNRISSGAIVPVGDVTIRRQTVRGVVESVVEIDFDSRASGEDIFDACVAWASQSGRAADATNSNGTLVHSYVRLREPDAAAQVIRQRYSESTGWVQVDTEEPWAGLAR